MIPLRLKKVRNYSSGSFVAAVSCDFLLGYLARDQFLPRSISLLCKQDSKMLHEQQPDSNKPTIIEIFGENWLFNPGSYCE